MTAASQKVWLALAKEANFGQKILSQRKYSRNGWSYLKTNPTLAQFIQAKLVKSIV
jgi:hypothetical protein